MKKILKIAFFILLFLGTAYGLVAANKVVKKQQMQAPIIDLEVIDGISLLTETELLSELKSMFLYSDNILKEDLKTNEIETYIRKMNEVKDAHVYMDIDNKWHIDLTTRRPVARIMNDSKADFYIDEDFQLMRLSPYAKPKILTITGLKDLNNANIDFQTLINNDSLKTKYLLDQTYRISNYVCRDAFYSAQIMQVHYTEKDGFVLIPRVGNHKIIFGKATSETEVEDKFKKLTTFYDEVIPYEGWNKYETINLKFKNQIVAKKIEE